MCIEIEQLKDEINSLLAQCVETKVRKVQIRKAHLPLNIRATIWKLNNTAYIALNEELSEEDQLIGLYHELAHLLSPMDEELIAKLLSIYMVK